MRLFFDQSELDKRERWLHSMGSERHRQIERELMQGRDRLTGQEAFKRFMNFNSGTEATGTQSQDYGTTGFHPMGAIAHTKDGRRFRYCKAGAALTVGDFIQSPAVVTTHLTMTAAAAAIGATSVTFTLGGTNAAVANQYAEGYLMVAVTPGMGRSYVINGHPAAALSTALTVQLDPSDPIVVALSTASRVHLIANPYNGVIQMPITTATGICVGVAASAIESGQFGWLQTKGMCCALTDGTPALGASIMVPGAVAGAGEVVVAAGTLVVAQFVGRMAMVGVDNVRNAVMLDID